MNVVEFSTARRSYVISGKNARRLKYISVRMQTYLADELPLSPSGFWKQLPSLLRKTRHSSDLCRDREPNQWPIWEMRHNVPLLSSVTSNAPSCATATPTGRPQTLWLSTTNPVRKSSYSPVGTPWFSRTRTTL